MADARGEPPTLTASRDRILHVAAQQEGLFHQAQLDLPCATIVLAHLARLGEVVPVRAGVYRHAAHHENRDQEARASWIATEGETLNHDRCTGSRPVNAVIGGSSAARRFGLELGIDPLLWVSAGAAWPTDGSHWMLGDVESADVDFARGGYPYTSLERTICDALLLGATPSLIYQTLSVSFQRSRALNRHRLDELLDQSTVGRRLAAVLPKQQRDWRRP